VRVSSRPAWAGCVFWLRTRHFVRLRIAQYAQIPLPPRGGVLLASGHGGGGGATGGSGRLLFAPGRNVDHGGRKVQRRRGGKG
jgi:hypothetical protein